MPIFLGAVADDDTGATDLGSMLTEQGMRVAVVLDTAEPADINAWSASCDAMILGTASRSIQKEEAYKRTRAAVRLLRQAGAQRVLVKYCSTFDSTPQGNIGASIDAAMDEMEVDFTVALPALPALGRTTYMGYHFVGRQLLSDSPLRTHPLNPMTNSNLVSHLASQTTRKTGLVTCPVIRDGVQAVRAELTCLGKVGVGIALLDCTDDEQLQTFASACEEMPLLTGSSSWGMVLPKLWRSSGEWMPAAQGAIARADSGSGILIVSGSCSPATARQNAWARSQPWELVELDALALANGEVPGDAERVSAALANGKTVVLTTQGSGRQDLEGRLPAIGLSPVEMGERISLSLAAFVQAVFARCSPKGLIVAGGETSSVLARALHLGGMLIGPAIEPGVPVCVALAKPQLAVVLKSGNFGSEDFYGRAIVAINSLPLIAAGRNEERR